MNFFLDHDVPIEIARILSGSGHDVSTVSQALAVTASDEEVFQAAIDASRILVTCNRDDFLALAKEREPSVSVCSALFRAGAGVAVL